MCQDRGVIDRPGASGPGPIAVPSDQHPGMANYPSDETRPRRSSAPPSANRYLPPLDEDRDGRDERAHADESRNGAGGERVTVTRAAAQRSREMGSRMYGLVHRAATADGADKSGLTALTWPVVANFAVDAAMAVALANTLFFAAASAESKGKVALYLSDHHRAVRRDRPADRPRARPAATRPARGTWPARSDCAPCWRWC